MIPINFTHSLYSKKRARLPEGKFVETRNLVAKLATLVVKSPSTLSSITKVLQQTHSLYSDSVSIPKPEPEQSDVANFLSKSFPEVNLMPTTLGDDFAWGEVSNEAEDATGNGNVISIIADLCKKFENLSDAAEDLLPPYYGSLLIIVLLHELTHALTKYFFQNRITTPGYGPTDSRGGEAGVMMERELFGGMVLEVWKKGEKGQMGGLIGLCMRVEKEKEEEVLGRGKRRRVDGGVGVPTKGGAKSADYSLEANNTFLKAIYDIVANEDYGKPFPTFNYVDLTPLPNHIPGQVRSRVNLRDPEEGNEEKDEEAVSTPFHGVKPLGLNLDSVELSGVDRGSGRTGEGRGGSSGASQ